MENVIILLKYILVIYKKPTIHIIIDGNTGKTIQEIILQYKREGGVMSPFEEFIDKL